MDRIIELVLKERRTPFQWFESKSARKWQKQIRRKERAYQKWARINMKEQEARDKKWGIKDLIGKNLIYNASFFDTPPPALYIDWPLIKKKDVPEHYYEYPEDPNTFAGTNIHRHQLRLLRNRTV
jgi:hypothetical protein